LRIYYKTDDGPWQFTALNSTSEPDSFYGAVPAQNPGSQISYYIKAADNSGRVETHPFIGQPWAHNFSVNIPPQIASPDSFAIEAGAYFSYIPEITDADDSEHLISYADYPAWLTVQNDSIYGNAPDGPVLDSFYIEAADPYDTANQLVVMFVFRDFAYAYLPGDVNMYNGDWPPSTIGSDVTYLVNYFRGIETSRPCRFEGFWASADANGDCNVIGSDVTKLVTYFRGAGILYNCIDFEPLWPTPDALPEEAPEGWPNCDIQP